MSYLGIFLGKKTAVTLSVCVGVQKGSWGEVKIAVTVGRVSYGKLHIFLIKLNKLSFK